MEFTKKFYLRLVEKAALYSSLRPILMKLLENAAYNHIVGKSKQVKTIAEKKYQFLIGLVKRVSRGISQGYINPEVLKKTVKIMTGAVLNASRLGDEGRKKVIANLREKYGLEDRPSFLVVSPTKKCNLQCIGCYASSTCQDIKLKYDVLDKIVGESHHLFGNKFMTISGGEPLMYNDNGKTLFDIWKKYPGMFFMFYTNGTLITKEVAKKFAELGNVSPAISIEGYEKETDCRRGKGIHKKILEAMKNLREAGVPFGVSVTATSKNAKLLLDDRLYKFWFDEQGVSFMWMFQLMPIGKALTDFKLMLNPKQRVALFHEWEKMLAKGYPIADFWNSGMLADGCIAYGRTGGYIYIDWDGKICPCAFVPYYVDNVYDLYAKGKSLADALTSDFFKRGREWQKKYGLDNKNKPDNWLMPCSIRDHYDNFRKNIMTGKEIPENPESALALKSPVYKKTLDKFDKELEKITLPLWKKVLAGKKPKGIIASLKKFGPINQLIKLAEA